MRMPLILRRAIRAGIVLGFLCGYALVLWYSPYRVAIVIVSVILLGALVVGVAMLSHLLTFFLRYRRHLSRGAAIAAAVSLLIGFVAAGGGAWYSEHHDELAPLLTLTAGIAVAGVALMRHFAQTEADRQRRFTDSFSKAIEQLGSDKIEVRLGGIYALGRIARESPGDYWSIMETLAAFVRERARWHGPQPDATDIGPVSVQPTGPVAPPVDIAAVLTVIRHRPETERNRERDEIWRFDLSGTDLRGANLYSVYLEHADLRGAHLEGADLTNARFGGADFRGAYFTGADLNRTDLIGAKFDLAHLEDTYLANALLYEHVDLDGAFGNAGTRLPRNVRQRPAHWPADDV